MPRNRKRWKANKWADCKDKWVDCKDKSLDMESPDMDNVPPPWIKVFDLHSGRLYYWNKMTNDTTWQHPNQQQPQLVSWIKVEDLQSGKMLEGEENDTFQ